MCVGVGAKERVETVRVSGMVDQIGQQGKEGRVLGFWLLFPSSSSVL